MLAQVPYKVTRGTRTPDGRSLVTILETSLVVECVDTIQHYGRAQPIAQHATPSVALSTPGALTAVLYLLRACLVSFLPEEGYARNAQERS